jgi:AAHS family 4-hydroxybenzoate transporter-like MFS transporter
LDNRPVDVPALIDRGPVSGFQIRVVILCALVCLLDGYDTQSIGYTAPLIAQAVNAPMSAFGPVFSAGLLGAAIGALTFGSLADRAGRKWPLIVATLVFAAFTLLTMTSRTLGELLAFRFLAGLGLGGATPAFIAIAAEYAPARRRRTMVTVMYAAFPLGGLIGGIASATLIPLLGWPSIYWLGGIAPIVLAVVLMRALPESLRFLLARGKRPEEVRRIVGLIAPDAVGPHQVLTAGVEQGSHGLPVRHLFGDGRASQTLLLWGGFFMVFMVLVTVTAWTPTVLRSAGLSLSAASLIIASNNLGSVGGNALAGWLADRFASAKILIPGCLIGALCLALFGRLAWSVELLAADSALAGFFVGGSSAGMIALAAIIYPTFMRSTGVGWAMGLGRCGQIFGPLGLGALVGWGWNVEWIFYAAAVPCVVAAVFVSLLSGTTFSACPGEVDPVRRQRTCATRGS